MEPEAQCGLKHVNMLNSLKMPKHDPMLASRD